MVSPGDQQGRAARPAGPGALPRRGAGLGARRQRPHPERDGRSSAPSSGTSPARTCGSTPCPSATRRTGAGRSARSRSGTSRGRRALRGDAQGPRAGPRATEAAAQAAATVAPAHIRVQVFNGAGTAGLGTGSATTWRHRGFDMAGPAQNWRRTGLARTVVRYDARYTESVKTLAAALPGARLEKVTGLGRTLQVVVGPSYDGARAVRVEAARAAASAGGSGRPRTTPAPDDARHAGVSPTCARDRRIASRRASRWVRRISASRKRRWSSAVSGSTGGTTRGLAVRVDGDEDQIRGRDPDRLARRPRSRARPAPGRRPPSRCGRSSSPAPRRARGRRPGPARGRPSRPSRR